MSYVEEYIFPVGVAFSLLYMLLGMILARDVFP